MHTKFKSVELLGRVHLEDLGIDELIILKFILEMIIKEEG